jgi:hypothetical protein
MLKKQKYLLLVRGDYSDQKRDAFEITPPFAVLRGTTSVFRRTSWDEAQGRAVCGFVVWTDAAFHPRRTAVLSTLESSRGGPEKAGLFSREYFTLAAIDLSW